MDEKKKKQWVFDRKSGRKNRVELRLSDDELTKLQFHMEKKLYSNKQDFFRACLSNSIDPEIHNYKIRLLKELNRIGVNFNQAVFALNTLAKNKNQTQAELICQLLEINNHLLSIEQEFRELRHGG